MEIVTLFCALVLPWLAGVIWVQAILGNPRTSHWAAEWGVGYLLGIFATTLLMRLVHFMGYKQNYATLLVLLSGLALLGLGLSFRKKLHSLLCILFRALKEKETKKYTQAIFGQFFKSDTKTESSPGNNQHQGLESWQSIALGILLGLLLLRLLGMGFEMIWRPLVPWDAWASWSQKAKVWYELQTLAPFVDIQSWLQGGHKDIYTSIGHDYPITIPLLQVWIAMAVGHWNDALISLPWLQCGMALGLCFYGQLRQRGCDVWGALLFTYLLVSMPFLDTHIALGGYADLWLTSGFAMAVMTFIQWVDQGDPRQGILAILMVVFCITSKEEGVVWAFCVLPAVLVTVFSFRALVLVVAGILAGMLLILWNGGLYLDFGMLGKVTVTANHVQLFGLEFQLGFHPLGSAPLKNLLLWQNWHLFWYVWPALFVWVSVRTLKNRSQSILSLVVVTGVILLVFIFFFTENYRWVLDSTAFNRLVLHLVPVLAFHLAWGVTTVFGQQSELLRD